MKIAVIGTGLIGTSIALALREHDATVWLADADPTVSLETVRRALGKAPGTIAQLIHAEREER